MVEGQGCSFWIGAKTMALHTFPPHLVIHDETVLELPYFAK